MSPRCRGTPSTSKRGSGTDSTCPAGPSSPRTTNVTCPLRPVGRKTFSTRSLPPDGASDHSDSRPPDSVTDSTSRFAGTVSRRRESVGPFTSRTIRVSTRRLTLGDAQNRLEACRGSRCHRIHLERDGERRRHEPIRFVVAGSHRAFVGDPGHADEVRDIRPGNARRADSPHVKHGASPNEHCARSGALPRRPRRSAP